jgi:hypothetical protein
MMGVAAALEGSWRTEPVPLASLDDGVVEPAIRGGAGTLLGRRIGEVTRSSDRARSTLRDLLRHQVIEAARFERGLEQRLVALATLGIRPIVIKGWSVARLYPQKGLRHYSDLDLCVAPKERRRAAEVLDRFAHDRLAVDLHEGLPHVAGRDPMALLARLSPVPLGDAEVVTLGAEDHLWLLALHALGHGAWRPVWLCDLALVLEQRGAALDWDYLFAGPARDATAVRIALQLAHRVLGARVSDTPVERWAPPPRWIEPALRVSWDEGYRAYQPLAALPPIQTLGTELRRRWPNPIRATAAAGGPWNEWPRAPLQLLDSARRALRFAMTRDATAGIWKR